MSKQTKLSEMPIMALAVTIIVMIGALLGVLYYFAANISKLSPSIVVAPVKKEVTVKTDKGEYEQGEDIIWYPQNYKMGDLFLLRESCNGNFTTGPELEEHKNGIWRKIEWYNPIEEKECFISFLECTRLKNPFNGVIKTKHIFGNKEIFLGKGIYRIKMTFGKTCEQGNQKMGELKNLFTVYSDEFTIKEKQTGVTISTDKTEYELGENIIATLSYKNKIYQWDSKYAWSIQKLENNTWVVIQRRGDPYFFCSNTPECKDVNLGTVEKCSSVVFCERSMWYEVVDVPKLIWDQSYKVEEKKFSCEVPAHLGDAKRLDDKSCAIFSQVSAGKYKIRFEYAVSVNPDDLFSREIDIRYAEKEFTIREKSAIDPRCGQKVKGIGPCEMAVMGYEFDSESGRCVKKTASGCSAEIPFNSLEECQKTCEKEAVIDKELKFETIDDADWAGVGEKKNYIIKSKKEWQDVWAKAGHSAIAPEVDFAKEMIIAVFYGVAPTGGYSVEIIKVIESLDKLTVFIKETSPGSDCIVTQALTEPRHIIKVQRVDKEAAFNVVSEIKNCSE